ncbi:MAG TPA: PLD nuclease N-terminal domain-containing protein [Solirubrobacterales bacterium]|nr:PLD nuclease N-terminal domain-containing protein [Solirubrobacterales bacterium]
MRTRRKQKRKKRRWSELTPCQRRAIVVAGTAQIGLFVAALRDLRRRPADQVNGPKPLWGAISFVNFVGPIAYFAFGRKR